MTKLIFAKKIYFSFILLLFCSTIIAIAGIKGFKRLAPAINIINSRNTQSLYYAEQMLTNITKHKNLKKFELYLNKSKENITERQEKEALINIEKTYKDAFLGNEQSEEETIGYIVDLSSINRKAMEKAGNEASKLENVGIWIIIFPTVFAWIIGIALLKLINQTIVKPLSELHDVISSYRNGNNIRRCPKVSKSEEFQKIYNDLNAILDMI